MKTTSRVWYNPDLNRLGVTYIWGRNDLFFQMALSDPWDDYDYLRRTTYRALKARGWIEIGIL